MKRYFRAVQLIFYSLLLCSCSIKGDQTTPIILTQRYTALPETTQEVVVERVAEEKITAQQKTVYTKKTGALASGEKSWVAKEIDSGSPAMEVKYYNVVYDYEGNELSKTHILGEDLIVPASPRIRQFGAKVEQGAFFYPSFSRYGVDCEGCKGEYTGVGNTSIGIKMDVNKGVMQKDGTWKQGITWEGYYIVAADKSIPFCSILKITNHNYSGEGLKPNEPFYAIVLDRGGAITNNRLDFYVGSENWINKNVKSVSKKTPLAEIVRLGGLVYLKKGYTCKL